MNTIPLRHLAAKTDLSVESLRRYINRGKLQAVEYTMDENRRTVLAIHSPGNSQGKSLYIMEEEAERFIEERRKFKENYKPIKKERPIALTDNLEQEILQIAEDLKRDHGQGKVIRKHLVGRIQGFYDLYQIIKWVLDQHTEEYPFEDNALGLHEKYVEIRPFERPKNLTQELEAKILHAAKQVKAENPRGRVIRKKVLVILEKGKRVNMYDMVKFVLDQHLEEYPLEHVARSYRSQ